MALFRQEERKEPAQRDLGGDGQAVAATDGTTLCTSNEDDLTVVVAPRISISKSRPPRTAREETAKECGWQVGHIAVSNGEMVLLRVISPLGMGSLGVVEEVASIEPGYKTFVRKRVPLPYYYRRQRLRIIKEEAKVLEELSHLHIVQIIGSYEETSQAGRSFYSLLMAPVGDDDLKTFLDMVGDQNPAPAREWNWLRQWFTCLISAVAYFHEHGVRHQDIKPSNIIHRGSNIYFTDFSSASQIEIGQTTSTETPARTSAMYAASEVVKYLQNGTTLQRHGLGADIFSLGGVFMEILTVIDGRLVGDFHRFLQDLPLVASTESLGQRSHSARGILLHSKVLQRCSLWFKASNLVFSRNVFEECILPMLQRNRQERPSAVSVLRLFRMIDPLVFSCPCFSFG
ncbi:kinase-like protein [Lepidopterella palustris CBS 459.81]|uniref:Kinase-like protein n=1 Tax=Lepidopterella palustris CBS 459.81 TaxID=1314670 RepID=A0A8E2JDH3_9PEZI|nr:kinase-like protein [Lepidopterella palustris CBS 459.81]